MSDDRNRTANTDATRRADPTDAATDQENARRQEQVQRDHDAMQRSAERVESSVPSEIRDRTVGEIVDDAERRADREGRGSGNV